MCLTATQLYQNGALVDGNMILNDYKIYPNPYIVLTHASIYSKHYYAGSQRVASRLLDGADQFVQQNRQSTKDKATEPVDAEADFYLYLKKAGFDTSKLESEYAKNQSAVADVYYYHGDHLGSSTYITNSAAETTQFFLNLPFGETMAEQMTGVYDNPFKFNAKELDSETGLYYYGARYFNPRLSIWYGVDPLAEKYPEWDPYAYTFQNPINYTDPTGMEPDTIFKNKITGKTVEIDDGRDDVIEVGVKDFAYARTYAAALKQSYYDSPELVDKYKDFFYNMKYGEEFSEEKIAYRALDAIANNQPGDYWKFGDKPNDIAIEPPKYYGGTADFGVRSVGAKATGWIASKLWKNFSPGLQKVAQQALKNGKVGPVGEQGILALTKSEISQYAKQGITGYTHKLKMKGVGGNIRILGAEVKGSKNHFLFNKIPGKTLGH